MNPLVRACGLALVIALALICLRATLLAYVEGQAASRMGFATWREPFRDPFPELTIPAEGLAGAAVVALAGYGLGQWWQRSRRSMIVMTAGATAVLCALGGVAVYVNRPKPIAPTPAHRPDIFDTLPDVPK